MIPPSQDFARLAMTPDRYREKRIALFTSTCAPLLMAEVSYDVPHFIRRGDAI